MTGIRMAEQNGTEQNQSDADALNAKTAGSNEADSEGQDPQASSLSLREQLEAARAERDANYNLYLRAQAELQNYRKRVQKEADEMRTYQSLPLGRDLLPALDNLHRALAAAETTKNIDKLLEGIRLVAKQIEAALSRHQIVPIEAAGNPFDPNFHQAVQHMPTSEHPPMTVMHEVERGFTLQDRVVRPATVIVAQAPAEQKGGQSSEQSKKAPATEGKRTNADI
jgi:molecular chaperone GrpE